MKHAFRIAACAAVGCLVFGTTPASAEEMWSVFSGRTTVHFNTDLMNDLGLSLVEVNQSARVAGEDIQLERPHWSFQMAETSDLTFFADRGIYASSKPLQGSLYFEGGFGVRDNVSGQSVVLSDFEISPATRQTDIGPVTTFTMGIEGEPAAFDLAYGGIRYQRDEAALHIYAFDVQISEATARQIGRPELAGRMIGMGEIRSDVLMSGGEAFAGELPQANERGGCTIRDVKLGILDNLSYVNGSGGVAGLSMATTSCNVGNCDIEWRSPMNEDHPGIAMAMYRRMDDRVEQIGVSNVKHGFFALSSSQCTPCQNPSGGTFLGVGCSDTYGVGNNSSRTYLAPRSEWLAFPGTWECENSHFAGGQTSCVRRHDGGDPHGNTEHRLEVLDSDLGLASANYFYEAYYVVRDDDNKVNNIGYRPVSVSGGPNNWNFTDGSGFPVIEGPVLQTWGDVQTWQTIPGDGQVFLASKATPLGGGMYHFEYALLNFDSDRKIKSFTVPLNGGSGLANVGYHDPDLDPSNDWSVTSDGVEITWSTEDHPIGWGEQFNFRFDAMGTSTDGDVVVAPFAGVGDQTVSIASVVPVNVASVPNAGEVAALQLQAAPNPMANSTSIRFVLPEESHVDLVIYDASGRVVKTLVSDSMASGAHSIEWDGVMDSGDKVSSGVYYTQVRSANATAVRSILVLE